ncbi:SCO family protein [Paracoccus seriniphilus]|uniref:Protein SCO1/2 n=1 Tax=Paracoccus seriniphilus TaxID=184748 RepID=A0A239Q322_9RHOB|nr:SCO family protein [Paracoccus seriniphilus]WCR15344.1 SCO family protein [Paracoccus seriniphilus]SNT76904.1 protein SCO1/2 [Paracoccus seriniphilus]
MRRWVLVIWLAAVLALGSATATLWLSHRGQVSLAPSDLGQGNYQLVQMGGAPFTRDTLRGSPSLVFFGFTHCPDVCPTTLGDLAIWKEELGEEGRKLRVFFVSVDPERDSASILEEYLGWLPGAFGITGSREETDRALRSFRVFARKIPLEGGNYTMDHSSSVLMFDAQGRFSGTIAYQAPPDEALGKIRDLLNG